MYPRLSYDSSEMAVGGLSKKNLSGGVAMKKRQLGETLEPVAETQDNN